MFTSGLDPFIYSEKWLSNSDRCSCLDSFTAAEFAFCERKVVFVWLIFNNKLEKIMWTGHENNFVWDFECVLATKKI